MKKIKILMAAMVLGVMSVAAKADVTNVLVFTVVGSVQQPAVTTTNIGFGSTNTTAIFTNIIINTSTLLKQIATDQSLTLPTGAKLGLINGQLVILNRNNSVFANVTVMTFSAAAAIGRTTTVLQKNTETRKSQTLQIVTISYSGPTLTFSLDILTSNTAAAGDNYSNGKQTNIIGSGYGFGYGTVGGAQMLAKGFLSGGGSGIYTGTLP